MQLLDALALLLPESPYYNLLSSLPLPDPSAPTATTTFVAQSAIHDSLPMIQEMVQILEKEENEAFTKEVDKRRMRLGAAGPETIRKEVGRELWSKSQVSVDLLSAPLRSSLIHLSSCRSCITISSDIRKRPTICDDQQNPSF